VEIWRSYDSLKLFLRSIIFNIFFCIPGIYNLSGIFKLTHYFPKMLRKSNFDSPTYCYRISISRVDSTRFGLLVGFGFGHCIQIKYQVAKSRSTWLLFWPTFAISICPQKCQMSNVWVPERSQEKEKRKRRNCERLWDSEYKLQTNPETTNRIANFVQEAGHKLFKPRNLQPTTFANTYTLRKKF